jgi:hypothetical protein
MAITLEQAKSLRYGQTLYHAKNRNSDGTPQRWRVNGKPQIWKRAPHRVRVPLKYGLYAYDAIDETTLDLVYLNEEEVPHE